MSATLPEWTPAHQARADELVAYFDARKATALQAPDGEATWASTVITQAKYYITRFEHGDVEMLAELDVALPEEMDEIEDMVRFFMVIEGTGVGRLYEDVRDGLLPVHALPMVGPNDPTDATK